MSGRSCYFYADNEDLMSLLEAFKELDDYKYVQMSSELNAPNIVYSDPIECFSSAIATPALPEKSQSFLIVERDQEVFTREIKRSDGSGILSIADQNNNFDSIVLAFGGDAGDQTLVVSDINTVGDTNKSIEMHEIFKKLAISKTKKVGAKGSPHRLMPGAIEKLKAGWRLAMGKGWSRDTDPEILAEEIVALKDGN